MNELILKNPITDRINDNITRSNSRLNIAVPFLSSFALSIIDYPTSIKIPDKRLITRFDEANITSFELPTLKSLLNLGFQIRFNNTIHLKLYITDDEAFITSSNLTESGFINNFELTVKIDSENKNTCIDVFNELWESCEINVITHELLDANMEKYKILKKREQYRKRASKKTVTEQVPYSDLDIKDIINQILNLKKDYSDTFRLEFEANKLREETKSLLKLKGFDKELFYVNEHHLKRRRNLFYDFAYGFESILASTGMREEQFKTVFEHPEFKNAINYIYPEMVGLPPWNLQDPDVFFEFCNGIFDFKIPHYSEAIPIRLASYFYPEFFLPIFKLDHLQQVSKILGLQTDALTKGERLYAYNLFLLNKLKALPFDNFIKMGISYLLLFTIELYERLKKGEEYHVILSDHKQSWKKQLIEEGKGILSNMKQKD